MSASGLEVADIFRQAGSDYRQQHAESLSRGQRCVMSAIERCRTAVIVIVVVASTVKSYSGLFSE